MRISYVQGAVSVLLLIGWPAAALAQCCPGDIKVVELAMEGLGETQPIAGNLSTDSNWRVYGFQRDGIAYYQVNDLAGRVQLIIGKMDEVFWVLPAGEGSKLVSLPQQPFELPAGAPRKDVYRHPDFNLVLLANGADAIWVVEAVTTAR